MHDRNRIAGNALVVLLLTLLAACGGSSDKVTNPDQDPPGTVPVASLTLDRTTVSLTPGQTTQLTATPRDAAGNALTGRAISWTSSAAGTASVSATGLVTAVAAGTATITATSEGRSANAVITITVIPVAMVEFDVGSGSIEVGATRTLVVVLKASDGAVLTGRTISWSSAQPSIATVANGVVSGVAPGVATITATAEGRTADATITVVPVAVASIELSTNTAALIVGQTSQVTATPRAASGAALTGRTVTWATSNAAVATVANGNITAVAPGSATITATSEGVDAHVAVTVTPIPVATVELTPAAPTIYVGGSTALTVTLRAANGDVLSGRDVTWNSSAPAVATVSAGTVTAVSAGTATITATSEGKTGAATVTVVVSPIASGTRIIGTGYELNCAIGSNGGTYCWGRGIFGGAGNGTFDEFHTTPGLVTGGHTFVSLASGYSHNCGIATDNTTWCWGRAHWGQLGYGGTTNQSAPVQVSGGRTFVQISAGGADRTCGREASGDIWCWGSNESGALGVGAAAGGGNSVPMKVHGTHVYRQLAAGYTHVCALREDGAAFCWGGNGNGQLGVGSIGSFANVPNAVTGGHQFIELAASLHTCGLKVDGSMWCWGFNSLGQLGDGTTTNRGTPVRVAGTHVFVSLALSGVTTCGLKADGSVWCWGGGSSGKLGNGIMENNSSVPVQVVGGHSFSQISGNMNAFFGVVGGAIYGWGANGWYTLGVGDNNHRAAPTLIGVP